MGSSTFQRRFGEDKYPIGRFIVEGSRALASVAVILSTGSAIEILAAATRRSVKCC